MNDLLDPSTMEAVSFVRNLRNLLEARQRERSDRAEAMNRATETGIYQAGPTDEFERLLRCALGMDDGSNYGWRVG